MRAFIIRPFGTRKGIDFDEVEKKLVGPALDKVGAEGRTTGEILEAGNIRTDMFKHLLFDRPRSYAPHDYLQPSSLVR